MKPLTLRQTRVLQLMATGRGGWTYGTPSQTNLIKRALTAKGLVVETPILGETFGRFEISDVGFAVAVTTAVAEGRTFAELGLR